MLIYNRTANSTFQTENRVAQFFHPVIKNLKKKMLCLDPYN